jgi:hypothetical protein
MLVRITERTSTTHWSLNTLPSLRSHAKGRGLKPAPNRHNPSSILSGLRESRQILSVQPHRSKLPRCHEIRALPPRSTGRFQNRKVGEIPEKRHPLRLRHSPTLAEAYGRSITSMFTGTWFSPPCLSGLISAELVSESGEGAIPTDHHARQHHSACTGSNGR